MIRKVSGENLRTPGIGSYSSTVSPTTETIVGYMTVGAGELTTGDVCRIRAPFTKGTGFNSTFDIRLYYNTSSSLTGAVQLGVYTVDGADPSPIMHRVFVIKSSSSLDIMNTTDNQYSSILSSTNGGSTVTSLNFNSISYFIFTVIRTSTGRANDSITMNYITLEV